MINVKTPEEIEIMREGGKILASVLFELLKNIKPGAIVIMHFNHPEWNTYEAMQKIVPKLRQTGYRFVRLSDIELTSDK